MGKSNQSSNVRSDGTQAAKAVCYDTSGPAGTSAGKSSKTGKVHKGAPRSQNEARSPMVHKRGSY